MVPPLPQGEGRGKGEGTIRQPAAPVFSGIAITPYENQSFQAQRAQGRKAFSLLEVMIASGIFFMSIFAILSLVSTNISNARRLQEQPVDPGMLLADLVQTNVLQEGSDSGDFGDLFPGYRWTCDITQATTNGLFKVEYSVTKGGDPNTEQKVTALLYRPDSMRMGGMGMH